MGASVPEMELMMDVLLAEQTAEVTGVVEEWVRPADRENAVDLAHAVESPVAGEAGQEMRRSMKIDVVAVVAVEQVAEMLDLQGQIVAAREGDELAEEMRVPEHEGRRLKRAEAAAHRHGAVMAVQP